MTEFIACFIPLFVAVNCIGILPLFMGITHDSSKMVKRSIVTQASFTAVIIGILFVLVGKYIFSFLGITIPDFQMAGGILLFTFALRDLYDSSNSRRSIPNAHIGIVPIGMPLIVGPGVLTTLLLMEARYGFIPTSLGFLANIIIVFFVFRYSDFVLKVIGRAGAIAIGKVFSIFLAAIGVMLVRRGVLAILETL